MSDVDTTIVAREFLRAVRGARSQRQLAMRLGYRGNPIADWEAGRRFPYVEAMLEACRVSGIDVAAALRLFNPDAARTFVAEHPNALGVWLDELRGDMPQVEVARRIPTTRSNVSRWLSGTTRLRVPDFLSLVQAITGRLPDLLHCLLPHAPFPSMDEARGALQSARYLAQAHPWSMAFVAVVDTAGYRALRAHPRGLFASVFGIPQDQEDRTLEALIAEGIVMRRAGRLTLKRPLTVDTGGDPQRVRELRRHWLRAAQTRVEQPREADIFAHNVFSVSRADFERLREMHTAFFRETRQVIANSEPTDVVAIFASQLFEWPLPLESPPACGAPASGAPRRPQRATSRGSTGTPSKK
jgi:transcriptional regulator with XRE-family HTH domain